MREARHTNLAAKSQTSGAHILCPAAVLLLLLLPGCTPENGEETGAPLIDASGESYRVGAGESDEPYWLVVEPKDNSDGANGSLPEPGTYSSVSFSKDDVERIVVLRPTLQLFGGAIEKCACPIPPIPPFPPPRALTYGIEASAPAH